MATSWPVRGVPGSPKGWLLTVASRRLIDDVRQWHGEEPDWRQTREKIAATYGPDRYGGNCHVVPNHALIILALLYGEDDFRTSLMIVNTIGTTRVACSNGPTVEAPSARMTSGMSATNSAAYL